MKKSKREKLEKELEKINEKVRLKREEVFNTKSYKSLKEEEDNLWEETTIKTKEIRELSKVIYGKYLTDKLYYWGVDILNVKSLTKEGIKRGLGVKYINLIPNDYIVRIVKELINEDLKKTNVEEIRLDIRNINEKVKEIVEKKAKVMNDGINSLEKEQKRIHNNLYKEKMNNDTLREKKREEVAKMIKESLPKHIENIRDEIGKGLILEGLS